MNLFRVAINMVSFVIDRLFAPLAEEMATTLAKRSFVGLQGVFGGQWPDPDDEGAQIPTYGHRGEAPNLETWLRSGLPN